MQVEIKIDPSQPEPKVVITAASMTEEVNRIVRRLSDEIPQAISGTRDGKLEVLEPEDLIRIYAASGKVFAVTGKGEYTLRLRLRAGGAAQSPPVCPDLQFGDHPFKKGRQL